MKKALLRARLLKTRRYSHSLRVAKLAQKIAMACGADSQAAYLAGLLHDCEKSRDPADLLARARRCQLRISQTYRDSPLLLHGPLGAVTARHKFGVQDKQILNAIKNHTLGRPGMSKLEKIIFVADYIEPGRRFPDAARIRKRLLQDGDLDRAVLSKARLMLKYARKQNWPPHKITLALASKK